jgi:PAS domain S-box-containing protein
VLEQAMLVSLTDRDGTILFVNDSFWQASGYSREELIGANHRVCNSGHHPREFFEDLWATILGGQTWRGTICNRAKNGSTYWVDTSIVPLNGPSGSDHGQRRESHRLVCVSRRRNAGRNVDGCPVAQRLSIRPAGYDMRSSGTAG